MLNVYAMYHNNLLSDQQLAAILKKVIKEVFLIYLAHRVYLLKEVCRGICLTTHTQLMR